MIAIKAVVKDGLIKPLKSIYLPEDKEIVIYIPEKKEEAEEYSEWTDEEWQKFSLRSFMNAEDESFSYQMMKHQEENKYFGKYLCQVTGDINKHYEREVIRIG